MMIKKLPHVLFNMSTVRRQPITLRLLDPFELQQREEERLCKEHDQKKTKKEKEESCFIEQIQCTT